MLYEAGSRDPLHPFSSKKFDELVKETEGDEADANRNFEVNHQDLKRTDGGFPDERSMDDPFGLLARDRLKQRGNPPKQQKIAPGPNSHGYPTETGFWQQALSKYKVVFK